MSLLTDELEELEEVLDETEDTVGNQQGPLTAMDLTTATVKINTAQAHIVNVLSLINDAGSADTNNLPSTLPAIADECVTLAQAARVEARKTTPNNAIIGNKVKTIDHIINASNGYKDRAGIT